MPGPPNLVPFTFLLVIYWFRRMYTNVDYATAGRFVLVVSLVKHISAKPSNAVPIKKSNCSSTVVEMFILFFHPRVYGNGQVRCHGKM